jgi:hypothetical protein
MNLNCPHRSTFRMVGFLLACSLASCAPQDRPQRSKVPREPVAESAPAAPDKMPAVVTDTVGGKSSLQYDAPESWVPVESGGMRRAAFQVIEGERQVEISVTEVPGSVEDLLLNVNRWRRQVQLGAITEAELEKTVSRIQVAGMPGHYVELLGAEDASQRQAVVRVLAGRDGRTWMFSLTGDADLAMREKARFQGFIRSARFSTAE